MRGIIRARGASVLALSSFQVTFFFLLFAAVFVFVRIQWFIEVEPELIYSYSVYIYDMNKLVK